MKLEQGTIISVRHCSKVTMINSKRVSVNSIVFWKTFVMQKEALVRQWIVGY